MRERGSPKRQPACSPYEQKLLINNHLLKIHEADNAGRRGTVISFDFGGFQKPTATLTSISHMHGFTANEKRHVHSRAISSIVKKCNAFEGSPSKRESNGSPTRFRGGHRSGAIELQFVPGQGDEMEPVSPRTRSRMRRLELLKRVRPQSKEVRLFEHEPRLEVSEKAKSVIRSNATLKRMVGSVFLKQGDGEQQQRA